MVVASVHLDQHKDLGRAVAVALARLPGASVNEWVLHMEDDVYPGPAFARLPEWLDAVGPDAGSVSFFGFRDGPDGVRQVARLWGAQCVAIRASVARGIGSLETLTYVQNPKWRYEGEAILDAAVKASGLRMLQVWPSLVQHRDRPSSAGYHGYRYSRSYRRAFGELPEEAR
jgi:hypothetical protein